MKRKELTDPEKSRPDSFENFVMAHAQERLIDLTGSAVPTTSNGILAEGEIGYRPADGRVYLRMLGNMRYITTTASV